MQESVFFLFRHGGRRRRREADSPISLTGLRDQLRARVSWRSAILIGFACGYLNERILKALQALLG